jgi:hypothetical protein
VWWVWVQSINVVTVSDEGSSMREWWWRFLMVGEVKAGEARTSVTVVSRANVFSAPFGALIQPCDVSTTTSD